MQIKIIGVVNEPIEKYKQKNIPNTNGNNSLINGALNKKN
jgi:hypothetical protein